MTDKQGTVYALKGEIESGRNAVMKDLQKMLEMLYLDGKSASLGIIQCKNGKKVGVETTCDKHEYLQSQLEYFKRQKCNVIFCPCCTKGRTIGIVDSMKDFYSIVYVEYTAESGFPFLESGFREQAHELRIKAGL